MEHIYNINEKYPKTSLHSNFTRAVILRSSNEKFKKKENYSIFVQLIRNFPEKRNDRTLARLSPGEFDSLDNGNLVWKWMRKLRGTCLLANRSTALRIVGVFVNGCDDLAERMNNSSGRRRSMIYAKKNSTQPNVSRKEVNIPSDPFLFVICNIVHRRWRQAR